MGQIRKISMIAPVVLFIIGRWVFDSFSPSISDFAEITLLSDSPKITNWQVFYYVTLNLAWIIYLINLRIDEYDDDYKSFYSILGLFFAIDIFLNLIKINMRFDEYVISVSNLEQNILITGLISALLINLFIIILTNIKRNQCRKQQ